MGDKLSDNALTFEAVKVALRQDSKGYCLVLSVHPNDVPEELFKLAIGSRAYVAYVPLDDNDQPLPVKDTTKGNKPRDEAQKAIALAGILCREVGFQRWLVNLYDKGGEISETHCKELLKEYLCIASRRELATDSMARDMLMKLAEDFRRSLSGG